MQMKEVVVTISKTGETNIEVIGAVGSECDTITADLENKLGVVKERKLKPEYYQQTQLQNTNQEFVYNTYENRGVQPE